MSNQQQLNVLVVDGNQQARSDIETMLAAECWVTTKGLSNVSLIVRRAS